MSKLIPFVLISSLLTSPAFAQSPNVFYSRTIGMWDVMGVEGDGKTMTNNSCLAKTKWDNGSIFALIQDLKDGEMYVDIHMKTWNIAEAAGTTGDLTMYFSSKTANETLTASFVVLNPQTIRIPQITIETFLKTFDKYGAVEFVFPGNLPKLPISLNGSSTAIGYMVECMEKEKTMESSDRNPKKNYNDSLKGTKEAPKTIIDPSKPSQDT